VSRFRNFSRRAALDLDETVGWLLDQGAAALAAEELLATVLAAGERLAERPLLGRRRPDLLPEPYRFWSIPRWRLLLVYDPETNPATILRVLNTAQDLPPLLWDLRDPSDPPEGGV
jgi:plasmid stabilization system protein ParE